ncbi:alpha/beta family hydrolase [Marinomonas ostreistagni]|uniref:alpha/beta family hydrolase n=1 Tax=Marinomonas ostreistagni TaxID=359209 RepID=UPI0019512995|nr:hydrolase [Marinomonas ostreistagni]
MTKLYLLHGSGAGHQSDFLQRFKAQFEARSGAKISPITLAYMQQIEATRKKRPPPAIDKLIAETQALIDPKEPIILLGKSMGCRITAELCASHNVQACVALGFPFYPAKKPEKHRLGHLQACGSVPYLILQGTRDALGSQEWVAEQTLPESVCLHWLLGADHDFHLLKRYNRSQDDVMNELVQTAYAFVAQYL